jgi:hypothetical protein
MKNLPEDEIMKSLKQRLATYAEEPDDESWDKISVGLSKPSRSRLKPVAWGLLFVGYSALLWFGGSYFGGDRLVPPTNISKEALASGNTSPASDTTKVTADHRQEKSEALMTTVDGSSSSLPLVSDSSITEVSSEQPLTSAASNSQKTVSNDRDILNLTATQSTDVRAVIDTTVARESTALAPAANEVAPMKKDIKKNSHSFPTVYFMAGPSLAYQRITPSVNDQVMITSLNSTGVLSVDRLGWSAEGGVQWNMTDKFLGYAGLSYYQQNGTISYSYKDGADGSVERSDVFYYVVTPRESTREMSYKMRNAGISVAGLYHLQGLKLRHYIGAGLQFQTGMLSGDDSYQNKGSLYLNYRVQYRIEFVMSRNYRLFMQPYYSSTLWTKESLDEPFDIRPYRAGLEFGGSYFFR